MFEESVLRVGPGTSFETLTGEIWGGEFGGVMNTGAGGIFIPGMPLLASVSESLTKSSSLHPKATKSAICEGVRARQNGTNPTLNSHPKIFRPLHPIPSSLHPITPGTARVTQRDGKAREGRQGPT